LKQQENTPVNKPYLVIAHSGRALASSAATENIETHVIDRFSDMDTQTVSLSTRKVGGDDSGLCEDELLKALDDYSHIPLTGVVVGSGLENNPNLLNIIGERFTLIGNQAECIKLCTQPHEFFSLLDTHGILYPEIQQKAPDDNKSWLKKLAGGYGGHHIKWYKSGDQFSTEHYLQRYINGRPLSVVFLANGKSAQIIGENEIWPVDPVNNNFTFSGAVSLPNLEEKISDSLVKIVDILVDHLQLKGLCGLDVIVDTNNECYVLELNPRPTATFPLHELGTSLFDRHLLACRGQLKPLPAKDMVYRGHLILYAREKLYVPNIEWPAWSVDRPCPGTRIAAGEPICTIHATANSLGKLKASLKQRKTVLKKSLGQEKIAT